MSTKPDDSALFSEDINPEQPAVSEMSDQPSTAADVKSASSSTSAVIITNASQTLNSPETRVTPPNGTSPKLIDCSLSPETVTDPAYESINTPSATSQDSLAKKPDITLYFLQSSRSIRIAWLLEELSLEYKLGFSDREDDGSAPENFKIATGANMGKAPVLTDGDLVLQESGAITEYDSLFASRHINASMVHRAR